MAVLGVNGRGQDHIKGLQKQENAQVVCLCDPDKVILKTRADEFETQYGKKVKMEQDLRRVFDDKSIDAVSIATPNHWHTLAAIWAMQAGKDVYVEKPGTHNLYEGKKLIEAASKVRVHPWQSSGEAMAKSLIRIFGCQSKAIARRSVETTTMGNEI